MTPTRDERVAFLRERRALSADRFDRLHSPHYDDDWGTISPTHERFVRRLLAELPAGADVLDAACGTGKYWPVLLQHGVRIVGTDHSAGMLDQAHRKHPDVPARVLALQDLGATEDLVGRFDALVCIDAMEYVGREDWPGVCAGLAGTLRPGRLAYVTVELLAEVLPPPEDARQVPGEVVEGGGYHYYPPRRDVERWLAGGGFTVVEQADGDEYWHLLLRVR